MEWLFAILLFFGVIAVAAVLFGGWLIVSIVRLIWQVLSHLAGPGEEEARAARGEPCGNDRCLATNPVTANFCRRCGTPLRRADDQPAARVPAVSRAAVWVW
jgi:hypothetical protein